MICFVLNRLWNISIHLWLLVDQPAANWAAIRGQLSRHRRVRRWGGGQVAVSPGNPGDGTPKPTRLRLWEPNLEISSSCTPLPPLGANPLKTFGFRAGKSGVARGSRWWPLTYIEGSVLVVVTCLVNRDEFRARTQRHAPLLCTVDLLGWPQHFPQDRSEFFGVAVGRAVIAQLGEYFH